MDLNNFSVVHYFSEQEKHKCGYCKQLRSSATYGMWVQYLTVHDYQELIDRGWRRSGKYCYKPIMDVTCCPMYTIRCEALDLKLSKSQKKILKRVNKFLSDGKKEADNNDGDKSDIKLDTPLPMELATCSRTHVNVDKTKIDVNSLINLNTNTNIDSRQHQTLPTSDETNTSKCDETSSKTESCDRTTQPNISDNSEKFTDNQEGYYFKQGEGMDSSKPPCKKAKLMRLERKREKLAAAGIDLETQLKANKKQQEGKTLEQFLAEIPENTKHKLKISLVRTTPMSEEWLRTSKISHDVYVKYQMAVHGDSREKCSENQFNRFLVESPLQPHYTENGPAQGYGSFHQQYWLDGKLIAVGVIDILPKCVSSVYFFYDPDYSNLSLGTYGSLRELNLTRELHSIVPELKYYYMGYYIHSCPKMRYKSNLTPSYLLCPETYGWFPIEACLEKLNIDAYARFNDDCNAQDENRCTKFDIFNIPVLYNYTVYKYGRFRLRFGNEHDSELEEYANLVGKRCASRMILVRE